MRGDEPTVGRPPSTRAAFRRVAAFLRGAVARRGAAARRVPPPGLPPVDAPVSGVACPGAGEPLEEVASRLRAELVEAVTASGGLADPAWRSAFAEVPRHRFVPAFHRPSGGGVSTWDVLTGTDPDPQRRAAWLAECYRDQALVTRLSPDGPCSSSSRPSLMALMLEQLRVEDGHRVLEIGTGTGYNAALLAHRLGARAVVTVDLDAGLTATARGRLAALGHPVRVVTGDGARGWRPGAPYDRVIATCEVREVPRSWLDQCRPGAVVLAPLRGGLLRLRVDGGGRAEGRFLSAPARFVPLRGAAGPRAARPASGAAAGPQRGSSAPRSSAGSGQAASRLAEEDDFAFVLGFVLPEIEVLVSAEPGGRARVAVTSPDGSVVRVDPDGLVLSSGPRDLGAEIDRAYGEWTAHGRPGRERFGVSVAPRAQWVWLDHPSGPWSRPLTAGC